MGCSCKKNALAAKRKNTTAKPTTRTIGTRTRVPSNGRIIRRRHG